MSDADIQQEFLIESTELLDQVERDLVTLEKGPATSGCLASIFRGVHTTKGTAGFLGYTHLAALTHEGESLLGRLRDGQVPVTPPVVSALLALVDAIRQMLNCIVSDGTDGTNEYPELKAVLVRLQNPEAAASAPADLPATQTVHAVPESTAKAADVEAHAVESQDESMEGTPAASEAVEALAGDGEHPAAEGGQTATAAANGTIRVDVGLLEKLMNLVGELVLTRNQVLQFNATQEDAGFLATSQRLNLITTELQEGVMKARMQPIGNIWGKFPRVVRDLALSCNKQVRIEMEGASTELDRTINEAIKDPLTHLIRNAVDHGIEPAEQRLARGKSAQGRILLRAFHEGGQVNIEIADDGRGIDVDRVRQKALERGVVTPEQAVHMTDREWHNVIFMPGFSTALQVSNVSGRGVGMDVVKTNVEKIGGTVDVQNRPGNGMSVHLKIPLTLAIIPALVITSGGDRFAIPQVSLLELVHLDSEQASVAIEQIHGAPVYRLRGNLLPLVYLNRELRLLGTDGAETLNQSANIVVLQAESRQFGMVVDEVNDTEEIVVKPLGKQLKGLTCFAGATIMGDGRVALILDVLGLAQRAHLVGEGVDKVAHSRNAQSEAGEDRRQTLLLFTGPDEGRMAIPLALVDRLEEFPASAVERVGGRDVVQYRGAILPLVSLNALVSERRSRPRNREALAVGEVREKIHVVVYSSHGTSVGLVVNRILDIVEETLTLQGGVTRPGVIGTAVIQGKVTEVLDVENILRVPGRSPGRRAGTEVTA
ncbi:MAG: chemotaxis protein CheA [Deltaproteobacteria bacterium]